MCSENCGSGNIGENENADDETFNIDEVDSETDSVRNELQAIMDINDDSQPNSRPGSSLNQSCESDVSNFCIFNVLHGFIFT